MSKLAVSCDYIPGNLVLCECSVAGIYVLIKFDTQCTFLQRVSIALAMQSAVLAMIDSV